MRKTQEIIVEKLKDELEYLDKDNQYSQWVLGVSIRKEEKAKRVIGSKEYTARVVIKTSDSPYVDGMDIDVVSLIDGQVILADYFEQTPEYQGGTVDDAIKWLKQLGKSKGRFSWLRIREGRNEIDRSCFFFPFCSSLKNTIETL